jgi:hypothetical protein
MKLNAFADHAIQTTDERSKINLKKLSRLGEKNPSMAKTGNDRQKINAAVKCTINRRRAEIENKSSRNPIPATRISDRRKRKSFLSPIPSVER